MKIKAALVRLSLFVGLFLGLGTVAFAADGPPEPKQEASVYGVLRRDMRKCMSPMCGGYWFAELNSMNGERYFNAL